MKLEGALGWKKRRKRTGWCEKNEEDGGEKKGDGFSPAQVTSLFKFLIH